MTVAPGAWPSNPLDPVRGAVGRSRLDLERAPLHHAEVVGTMRAVMPVLGAVALLLPLLACGASEPLEPLRLELPIDASHRSALIAVQHDDTLQTLVAADIVEGLIPPLIHSLPSEAQITVTAMLYEATLADHGFEAGPVAMAGPDDRTRALPMANQVRETQLDDGAFSGWRVASALPAELADVRVPALDPCAAFNPEEVSLGNAAVPSSVLALDDSWALVMTEGAEVYFTNGDRVVRQAVPVPLYSGYRRDDGRVWLGGQAGAVFSAVFSVDPEPQLELTAEGTVLSREDVIDLVGAPDGPVEHFAMTSNREEEVWGAFEWFDGERWRVPGLRRNTPHDATWVAPGFGLFASFFRDGEVWGARDGQEMSIDVTSVLLGNVVVIEQVPGFGLVAATTGGDVHQLSDGGEWRRITGSTSHRIGDVHGYEDGLVFLRGSGVAHYPLDGSECPDSALFQSDYEALNRMDVVGQNVIVPLVAREGVSVDEQHVGWFRRLD